MAHVNSTIVFTLDKPPDLNELAKRPNVQYNPARFRAAIVRPTHRSASILVFPNGRCVATGRDAECIRKKHKVVNRVYAGHIGSFINIRRLKTFYPLLFYEPEIFSGARLKFNGVTVIIFTTGRYFITGTTDNKQLPAVQHLLRHYG